MSRDRIDAVHLAWLDAMRTNDAEALGRLVTEDAVLMPPHEAPVAGGAGI